MRVAKRSLALALVITLLACGSGNFAAQLRSVLAGSAPLIDSLVASGVIKLELRDTYIRDFTDLADAAASLKENLDECEDKVCKLGAVEVFQQAFWDIQRRGHFGTSPKLRQVEAIIKAIISAAKDYYAPPLTTRGDRTEVRVSDKQAEATIEAKIKELKVVMSTK